MLTAFRRTAKMGISRAHTMIKLNVNGTTLRDGMMIKYKCIMVSDANATHTDEGHNAKPNTSGLSRL